MSWASIAYGSAASASESAAEADAVRLGRGVVFRARGRIARPQRTADGGAAMLFAVHAAYESNSASVARWPLLPRTEQQR